MPTVSLSFHKEGKEFQPRVFVSDIIEYEDKEEAALKNGRISGVLNARIALLEKVLARDGGNSALELTTSEVQDAFYRVWGAAVNRPLESPGDSERDS